MSRARPRHGGGFTLLEVLVALTVLVTVMAIVGATLIATVNGWDHGQRALDGMRRGEHVMDQLANALRSSAGGGASTQPGMYSFQINNVDGNPPVATMSWVTSSGAFLPPGSPLAYGLHRIALSIGQTADGRPALAVRSWPYLVPNPDDLGIEPGFLAPEVSGLMCRVYDYQQQGWQTVWPNSNALPALVEVTVFVNTETNVEPLVLQRLVEMPLGATNVTDAMQITLNPFPASGGRGKKKKGQKGVNGPGRGKRRGGEGGPGEGRPGGQRGGYGPPPPGSPRGFGGGNQGP